MFLPPNSIITITDSLNNSTDLWANSLVQVYDEEEFQRPEYSHAKLQEAAYENGAVPQYITTASGRRIQGDQGCGSNTASRPLTPDDSDVNNIYQKFEIIRYEFGGAKTNVDAVNTIFTLFRSHRTKLTMFQQHLREASGNASFERLEELQEETFDYLTDTGVTISGKCLEADAENILIVKFVPNLEYVADDGNGGAIKLKSWSMIAENRVILPAGSSV